MKTNSKTTFLVQFAILFAIEAVFCFTPLGSLPAIGPIVATLAHIPVILTAILLGTAAGTLMGFCTGLFSMIVWTFMPPAQSVMIAFVFSPAHSFGEVSGNIGSVLICFVPRILVGTVAGLVYSALSKSGAKDWLRYGLAGVLGSLVNTVGVMGGIWLFFGDAYASLFGMALWEETLTVGAWSAIALIVSSGVFSTWFSRANPADQD